MVSEISNTILVALDCNTRYLLGISLPGVKGGNICPMKISESISEGNSVANLLPVIFHVSVISE